MKKEKEVVAATVNQTEIDKIEILRLAKIVSPNSSDMESIFALYKKYVDQNARGYTTTGCAACGMHIGKLWRLLITFYNKNQNIFA